MLELVVSDIEKDITLKFEHSLLSLSKWEEEFQVPFLTNRQKTPDEMISYFQMMLLSPEDPTLVYLLQPKQLERLTNYINENRTASSVPASVTNQRNVEQITSELVYYWLAALKIPFHPTETWHLSRAVMLVQIAGYKNQPEKKRKPEEIQQDWNRINEERKKKWNTSG